MDIKEKEFLNNYDSTKYEKPSVTADIVIFTIDKENDLNILLIKRKNYPYKDKWAIPGGFVDINESVDDAARRELKEETGLDNIKIEQFYTFGNVKRDPRMRVITVAYFATVPKGQLKIKAGDDAKDAVLFKIKNKTLINTSTKEMLSFDDLAFDHKDIITIALQRLKNRIDYTDDILYFLNNQFTLYEAKKVAEIFKQTKLDANNFRREFLKRFGLQVEKTELKDTTYSKKAASIYTKKGGKI